MSKFISYMSELELMWEKSMLFDGDAIAFNVLNAALSMESMPYEEICVQLDVHNIRFMHDSSFVECICLVDARRCLSQLQHLPSEYVGKYAKVVEKFFIVAKKVQVESLWSK